MNKSFLKFIADFGPLLIFFTIYYKSGNNLSAAIPPLIVATIIAVALVYFIEKKIQNWHRHFQEERFALCKDDP